MADPTRTVSSPGAPAVTRSVADGTAMTADGHASSPTAPPPGAARYVLGAEIARGGMGVVYRATDTALGREVAIKVLLDRYAPGSATARRFHDEARITGQLQHPGIPPVHDLGTLPDGRPFLAMKLIKGETLDDLLKHRPDPATDRGRFVAVFEKVCEAVGYAHSRGVIHRDLKPANVMAGAFGEVQVMDWGLAKVLAASGGRQPPDSADPDATAPGTVVQSLRDSDGSETQAGSVLGTPAFMPPEQAVGAVGKIDARSDVFGLGGILAVILTDQPPFAASSAETTRVKAATGDVADCLARLDASGADPELVALGKRCLSPKPADRPADAGAVARAVAGLRVAADERARQAEIDRGKAEVQAAEQRKRRRVQLALAAAVSLIAVTGGGIGWRAERSARERAAERRLIEDRHQQETVRSLDRVEAAVRNENPNFAEMDVALAQAEERLAAGGSDELRARYAELSRCRQLLRRLDDIDDKRIILSHEAGEFERKYTAAFREFDLDPHAGTADEAADRLRRSPIAGHLTTALYSWLGFTGSPRALDLLNRLDADPVRVQARTACVGARSRADLIEVLAALDPDPVRRYARVCARKAEVKRLGEQIAGVGDDRLTPAFVEFVARGGYGEANDLTRLLRRVQLAHPQHFGLAMVAAYYHHPMWNPHAPRPTAAEMYYRIALAARPTSGVGWHDLPSALSDQADVRAAWDHAVRYAADSPFVWLARGRFRTHAQPPDLDGALADYRQAVRLDPSSDEAHYRLGLLYARRQEWEPALVELREAGRRTELRSGLNNRPGKIEVLEALADVYERSGEPGRAVEAYREAVGLGAGLKAVTPLVHLLVQGREYTSALRVCRDAARRYPDWEAGLRYDSACCACRAAAGEGKDPPPAADRPALRRQAHQWLSDELDAVRAWGRARSGNTPQVHQTVAHWLADPDLTSVRDPDALAELPADERVGWERLWAEVHQLHEQTKPREARPAPRRE